MAKNLVIVESPAKAKTIKNYLGKDYEVLASVGHVIDLPSSSLAVDINNNFKPTYEVIPGKEKVLADLRKAASKADVIYLASDPDREGEAIAWHIQEEIRNKVKNKLIKRVLFNEITKTGVQKAIDNPIDVNMSKVEAQQSRRILDRLVGYQVSPLLWKPLKYGLSAGRVQSVALRLVCEREESIEKFVPSESWTLDALFDVFSKSKKKGGLKASLDRKDNKKIVLKSEDDANNVIDSIKNADFVISEIEKKKVKASAPLPFTTAKLQQEAIRKLGFNIAKVMRIAQQLYEGIDLGSSSEGLITYMRTDSTRVSDEAMSSALGFINKNYGNEYLGNKKSSKNKQNQAVQDAHEAIRPTDPTRKPDDIKQYLSMDQFKLYKLIWERFIASCMSDALYEQTTVYITASIYRFRAGGRVLLFPGYTALYVESLDEDAKDEQLRPLISVTKDDTLKLLNFDKQQHFTTPPPRFSEAGIVKTLEQRGIGRPSTYASIISTILDREYVEIKNKKISPTELGRVVNSLLVQNFPNIFDETFTAEMEKGLDLVDSGDVKWVDLMNTFYSSFSDELKIAEKKLKVDLTLDIPCPKCGEKLTLKYGKNGSFIACTSYPECNFTTDYTRDEEGKIIFVDSQKDVSTGIICDKCGKDMIIKKSRYGDILACSGYPDCKNIKNHIKLSSGEIKVIEQDKKILNESCPLCSSGDIILKSGKNGFFAACSNYPKCKYTASVEFDDSGEPRLQKVSEIENIKLECNKCGKPMILKNSWRGPFYACTGYPDCKNAKSVKSVLKERSSDNGIKEDKELDTPKIKLSKVKKSTPIKSVAKSKEKTKKVSKSSSASETKAKTNKSTVKKTTAKTKTKKEDKKG